MISSPPIRSCASLKAKTKKQLLQDLSARAARFTGLQERDIFDVLLQRERLGSTGLGHGIAIPHGKLQGLKRIVGIHQKNLHTHATRA